MAHFAELDETNIVKRVIVVHNNELLDENGNESEQKGINFCVNLFGGTWIQTSFNNNFRKNYAGIGFTYDPVIDAFYCPQPFPSWTLDENARWQPPTPHPINPYTPEQKEYWLEPGYVWDEATLNWIEVPTE